MAVRTGCWVPASHRRPGRKLAFERLEDRQLLAIAAFTPVADTYLRDATPRGALEFMDVRGGDADFRGYLRFDLSSLANATITSATLELVKVPGASRNDNVVEGRFALYGLNNVAGNTPQNWNETTFVIADKGTEDVTTLVGVADLDGDVAGVTETIAGGGGDGTKITLTGAALMSFLQGRLSDGSLATFILSNDDATDRGYGIGTKENAAEANRPVLTIEYDEDEPPPPPPPPPLAPRQMEHLDRGLVVVRTDISSAYIGWRLLGTDPADIAFNLYRSAAGGLPVKINAIPLTQTTDFTDTNLTGFAGTSTNTYFVRPIVDGIEQEPGGSYTLPANAPVQQYLNIPLQRPAGGTVSLPPGTQTPPSGTLNYTYNANDASVGDLDGDGEYEIILKWDPSNSQDNANEGLTGNVIVDAYKLDGKLLWRIDLGRNIRAGAHYTQFLVYDFDGDGRAEVVMKTADGTIDGQGIVIGNPNADYRDGYTGQGDGRWGRVLTGPEFLTVFDGLTGAALQTINFSPARGAVTAWGDNYGNRVDRFLAAVAYVDGVRPSIVMARGYYAKTMVTAFDWRGGQLTHRWTFDSATGGNGAYGGQGNHNLSVADVDGDGTDEIIYGSMVLNDDGTGRYSTGFGHGDAMHVSDMDPDRPGLEVWQIHEASGHPGADFRNAATGEAYFTTAINTGEGPGRGVAADVWAGNPGYEMWGAGGFLDRNGNNLGRTPGSTPNFLVWWDADPVRELLDGQMSGNGAPRIDKYGPSSDTRLLTMNGAGTNNGTKATPALSADILGDWREEVIVRASDNLSLRIYTTTIPSTMRTYTLMHDPKYRLDIAWQNVAYNQPPHPGFFFGAGMAAPPTPQIYTVQLSPNIPGDYNGNGEVDAADYVIWRSTLGSTTDLRADGDYDRVIGPGDYNVWVANFGKVAPPPEAPANFSRAVAPLSEFESTSASVEFALTEPVVDAAFVAALDASRVPSQPTTPLRRFVASPGPIAIFDSNLDLLIAANARAIAPGDSETGSRGRVPSDAGTQPVTYESLDAAFERGELAFSLGVRRRQ